MRTPEVDSRQAPDARGGGGYAFEGHERFCPACGRERPAEVATTGALRRRIGGQTWSPLDADDLPPPPASASAVDQTEPISRQRRKRRRRRRRPVYRRPLVMVPLMLLLIAGAAGGGGLYRAQSTLGSVREVSQLPPRVTDGTAGERDGAGTAGERDGAGTATGGGGGPVSQSPLEFDTAPAEQALREAGVFPVSEGGGLFGQLQEATGNVGELAEGAAIAAGVKDPATEAITILVMGVDARPGAPIDIGVRPDALMVLRLDPSSGSCRGLAVPRDALVELPGYGSTKINHALMVGGIAYQKLVTERFLGITIDHYALIDFTGFQELVDAVGGVPVTVPAEITNGETVLFAAGPQIFDGEQALAYARYRGDRDLDVGRVRRQQQIIRGLIQVASGRSVASDVNGLLPPIAGHIRTDLGPAHLIALAEAYRADCGQGELVLDVLQGDLVQPGTLDPLFRQELAYVVVPEGVLAEKVGALLRGE